MIVKYVSVKRRTSHKGCVMMADLRSTGNVIVKREFFSKIQLKGEPGSAFGSG